MEWCKEQSLSHIKINAMNYAPVRRKTLLHWNAYLLTAEHYKDTWREATSRNKFGGFSLEVVAVMTEFIFVFMFQCKVIVHKQSSF